MNNQNDKAQMLRAMLAGQPTKESQALALKTQLYQDPKNAAGLTQQQLYESVNNTLPSASDVHVSQSDIMMASSNARALPAVSENDIMSMLSGQRRQPQQQQAPREPVYNAPVVPDYFTPSDANNGSFDVNAALKQRLEKRQLTEQKQQPAMGGIDPNTIVDLVEDIVYGILGQIVTEANENKLNKEAIRIKIGESIFSGKLEKSLKVPVKKVVK